MTVAPAPSGQQPPTAEMDLGQLLTILWAGKARIMIYVLVAAVIGIFLALNTPPTYRADALLQLEERSNSLALPEGLSDLMEDSPRSEAEIKIISSRMVLGQAVASLNLDWRVRPVKAPLIGTILARYDLPVPQTGFLARYARPGESIGVDLLQTPPHWLGESMELVITGPRGYTLTTPDEQRHDGVVGQTLSPPGAGFSIRLGEIEAPAGRAYEIVQADELSTIARLRRNLTVNETGRRSGILEARYSAGDRAEAEQVLNAITEAYLRQNIARSAAEAESSLEFIEQQLPEARAELRAAEAELNDYRQRQKSVDLSFETENFLTQITQLETELRALQTREDEIDRRYTQSHPAYQQLLQKKQRIEDKLATLREEVDALPETQREMLNLTRDVTLKQEIYTQLLTRAQEVRVLRASTVGNVRILDIARTAPRPVAPRRTMILGVALLLGAMAGVGHVLLRHWLRRGVQGSEELEAAGLPVFATINFTQDAAKLEKSHSRTGILALEHPDDLAVEAFRSLRTSLHFGMLDAETSSLAVTSAAPDAGKSFTSTNLAAVTALAGQSVCLIDADLRRGQLRKKFRVARDHPGLSEYLAGEVTLEAAMVETETPGLRFIPSGRYPPNPSELLMRDSMAELVRKLHESCDLTIFDCPPVLAVTDPVIIGRIAGATIAVVRHDVTPMPEVAAMQRAMQNAGIRLSGAILNGFDPRRAGSASAYSYNYRYEYRPRGDGG